MPDTIPAGKELHKNVIHTLGIFVTVFQKRFPEFTDDIVMCMEIITDTPTEYNRAGSTITRRGALLEINEETCEVNCIGLGGSCLEVVKIQNTSVEHNISTSAMAADNRYTPILNILRMHGYCQVIFIQAGRMISSWKESHPYCELDHSMNITINDVIRLNVLSNCALGQYRCGNGQCVSEAVLSDGVNDCSDTTDEPTYGTCQTETPSDRLRVDTSLTVIRFCCSGYALPFHKLCDGSKDCNTGYDESMCNVRLLTHYC